MGAGHDREGLEVPHHRNHWWCLAVLVTPPHAPRLGMPRAPSSVAPKPRPPLLLMSLWSPIPVGVAGPRTFDLRTGRTMMDDACLVLFRVCCPLKGNVTCDSSHLKPIYFPAHGRLRVVLPLFLSLLSNLLLPVLTLPPNISF